MNLCAKLETSSHIAVDQSKNVRFMEKEVEKALYLVVYATYITEANISSKVIFFVLPFSILLHYC